MLVKDCDSSWKNWEKTENTEYENSDVCFMNSRGDKQKISHAAMQVDLWTLDLY